MSGRALLPTMAAIAAACAPLFAVDDTAVPTPPHNGSQTAAGSERTLHSWELPAITVQGQPPTGFRDDDRVGTYGQPRWSTVRRFSEVRTYVIPEGQAEFEYWLFITDPSRREKKEASDAGQEKPKPSVKQMYEFEFGLGNRWQLDLYQVYVKDGSNGTNALDATKFELRYALADWDKLWGNPTIYAEWEQAAQGADSAEVKLLLCGDIAPRWAWATNFVWEQKTGDDRERSLEWNSAIAYDLKDQKLSVGVETNFAQVSALRDTSGTARDTHYELLVGPSIRFYPIPQAHIILSEFIGINSYAPERKTALIFGWEF